jgi:hypothetical protein
MNKPTVSQALYSHLLVARGLIDCINDNIPKSIYGMKTMQAISGVLFELEGLNRAMLFELGDHDNPDTDADCY